MLAAMFDPNGSIMAREVEPVPPAPGEVRIEVTRAGICGSDLHFLFGRWQRPKHAPGHEFVGQVEALGEGVRGWKTGERVTARCFGFCGNCPACAAGDVNQCENIRYGSGSGHGGMAQLATAYASALCRVEKVTDDQAVMAEPLAVGIRAAGRLDMGRKAGRIAVIGGGTIGLLSAAAAVRFGAEDVTIFVRYQHQAEVAEKLGVHRCVVGAPGDEPPYDGVIDAIANGETLTTAIHHVARHGTIVIVGCMTEAEPVRLDMLARKEVTLTGAQCYGRTEGMDDMQRAMQWLRKGKIDPTVMITHRFALNEIDEAFRIAADKSTGSIKVMLLPNG